jgi:hypothetical protein
LTGIIDDSRIDLESLLDVLQTTFPDIWESGSRSLILPQRMGDLEKPEVLSLIKNKIRELIDLEEMREEGSINQEDYLYMRIQILTNK